MILREIRLLREHFEIYTVSVRSPDRPAAELSAEERDEANRTYYVKAGGAVAALTSLASLLFSNPGGFVRGLSFAVKLAGLRVRQIALNLAYFAQAAIVGRWMRA